MSESTRVFKACISCKTRKRKCDGGTPRCSYCAARNAECIYEAVRRTRGPGKKKSEVQALQELSGDDPAILGHSSTLNPRNPSLEDRNIENKTTLPSSTNTDSTNTQISLQNRLPLFPDFLLQGTFSDNLKTYRKTISESLPTRGFTPLMPLQISRRLIQNSFTEIMAEHQLLDIPTILGHLEAQNSSDPLAPGDNPARWALVNAVIALAARFKIALGSESAFSDIVRGYYDNATRVLPELILQDPCLLSVQALLAMAMFARQVSDIQAFVMLASNASKQLEMMNLRSDGVVGLEESGQYEQVYGLAYRFDGDITKILGTGVVDFEVVRT
ncbi:putative transcriptional regulatory protein [Lachnellula suecica]|uniref:Putative transcriptional regulatory protein n=1 Tax=Lachnellula suecica TaxID=602035 RepID=A0A8T9CF85_9HELO|nr:putative transcriptional regulatory protein [Lachnellula suecica]